MSNKAETKVVLSKAYEKLGFYKPTPAGKNDLKFNKLNEGTFQEFLRAYFNLKHSQSFEATFKELQALQSHQNDQDFDHETYNNLFKQFQKDCEEIEAQAQWALQRAYEIDQDFTQRSKKQRDLNKILGITTGIVSALSILAIALPEVFAFTIGAIVGAIPMLLALTGILLYSIFTGTGLQAAYFANANAEAPTFAGYLLKFSLASIFGTSAFLLPIAPYIGLALGIIALGMLITLVATNFHTPSEADKAEAVMHSLKKDLIQEEKTRHEEDSESSATIQP
jgi:hypothetical protein